MAFSGIFSNRRVLVTGHTGFKGSWLCSWLDDLGAEVAGFSVDVPTRPSHYDVLDLGKKVQDNRGDIRDLEKLKQCIRSFDPEIIFHLAAQSLVRYSYDHPVQTFETNTLGTLNLLESMKGSPSLRAAVVITSDKCYRNVEWPWGYRESDRLGGEDPYSSSKACAELICYSYMQSFFSKGLTRVATARAGNVIGGGDWASDRIVPDCVRAWSKGESVVIRNPLATRPWQHVLEPLSGYLSLAAQLFTGNNTVANKSYNFGPQALVCQPVADLIAYLADGWEGSAWRTEKNLEPVKKESLLLKLCCDRALHELDWHAVLTFDETVRYTRAWYQTFYNVTDEFDDEITKHQIAEYTKTAADRNLSWANDDG